MSRLAVTLVLVSAALHAAWNLMCRRRGAEVERFRRMQLVVIVAGLAPAFAGWWYLRCLTPRALACVTGSGACCGLYYWCLARGYGSADFTTVYPAVRSLPVLLVGLGDVARGRYPSAAGWFGLFLVGAGCLLAPLRELRELRPSLYLNRASAWIVVAALGTVGYSVLDKIGTESIPEGPAQAAVYGYAFFLVAGVTYGLITWAFEPKGREAADAGWVMPAVAGVLNFAGYWLVLWVFQMTRLAGYVVAFRQFSIVLGVAAAFLIFKEPGRRVRTAGALIITAGLVAVKVWG